MWPRFDLAGAATFAQSMLNQNAIRNAIDTAPLRILAYPPLFQSYPATCRVLLDARRRFALAWAFLSGVP
jgi:hypothetical protein